MSDTKTILVTGGLGYIGSHTVVELFNKEYLKSNSRAIVILHYIIMSNIS